MTSSTSYAPSRVIAGSLLIALILSLLALAPAAAQQSFDLRLAPEDPNAIHARGSGSTVIASGSAPAGTLQDSRIIGVDGSGTEVAAQVVTSRDANNENFVRLDGTSVSGRITLNVCFGADPNRVCPTPNTGVQRLFLQLTIDGVTGRGPAEGLVNDYVRPEILRFDIVAPDQIVAVFTEPVRFPPTALIQVDRREDWTVDGGAIRVVRVENPCAPPGAAGNSANVLCERRRLITERMPEDLTPRVRYQPGGAIGEQTSYIDAAANIINASDLPPGVTGNNTIALDRVIPALPQIDQVAGRPATGGQVTWREPAPQLSLSNLTAGQSLFIVVDGREVAGPISVTGASQAVQVPDLGADRAGIPILVVARDPSGNCSQPDQDIPACASSGEGSPPRGNGANNPVSYTLDTVAPTVLSVAQSSETTLTVMFSEPVTPAGSAGRFTAGGRQPSSVTGEGAMRTLTFAQPVDATTLSWEPTPNAYVDRVQLALQPFTQPIIVPPAPPVPQITAPATRRVLNAQTIELRGTVPGAGQASDLVVEIYTDPQAPQSSRVGGDHPVRDGQWTASDVPLSGADGSRMFYARTRNTATGARSPLPASPSAEIVKDTASPSVDITSPSSGLITGDPDPVGRNEAVEVRWTASDANPLAFVLTLTDAAGTTAQCEEPVFTRDRTEYTGTCTVPDTFVGGNATIRLIATDQTRVPENTEAQRNAPAEDVFDRLPIDPTILGATGALVSNASGDVVITLDYGVPLSGSTNALDWRTNDGTRDGATNRTPGRASREGSIVTLDRFVQTFPGGLEGHPNARPSYTYSPSALSGQGLRGPDGQAPASSGRVRDVTPPRLTGLSADYGRVRGTDQRGQVASCADGASADARPRCPSGPVLVLRGETDRAFNYGPDTPRVNSIRVFSGAIDFTDPAAAAAAHPVADAEVDEEGTFVAAVGLAANRQQQFTVLATDIHGSQGQAPVTQVITVVEDSLGPLITSLTATLDTSGDQPVIIVPAAFDEVVSSFVLEYRLGGGDFQPIDTTSPSGTQTVYRWTPLPFDLDRLPEGLEIRATATDALGNIGPARTTGLSNLPRITGAAVVDEDTVTVTTSEPVTTDEADGAGFAIGGGPGVEATSSSGTTITLDLADPLGAGTFTVRYNGQGGWATDDGRPLAAGTAPISLSDEVLFPVTGLAGGVTETGAVISFIDERNARDRVTGYGVTRNGTPLPTMDPDQRILFDPDLEDGTYTYTVTVEGRDGAESDAVSTVVRVGDSPVDGASRAEAIGGGTGFPTGSEVLDDCPFPPDPNIGVEGGTVLSCDGRVAAIVPAGLVERSVYAAILRRSVVGTDGFDDVTDLYQLIGVEDAAGFPVVDAFAGYAELSYRDLAAPLADAVTERVTVLRPFDGAPFDEKAARVGTESVASQLITVGTFGVVQADGASVRIFGPDPAIAADRFATAVGLSQTQFRTAGFAVVARADDYPDALAAAPLAAQLGGPVLLSRSTDVPFATLAEMDRLQTRTVYLVGGTAALSADVEAQLQATGRRVVRLAGPSRFETAAEVAREVGSVDGTAFLATGGGFADALSASAPAAAIGRPILLTRADGIPDVTRAALDAIRATGVHVVGGEVAVQGAVSDGLAAEGFGVERSAGDTRYTTAVDLAEAMIGDDHLGVRQIAMASGDGDGITSPDALAAGPIAGRLRGVLLLTPQSVLTREVADFLADAEGLRGIYLAGGVAAVTAEVRDSIDAAAGPLP